MDMLHAFLLGIFKYVRETFFVWIGGKRAETIDNLSKVYCQRFGHQSNRSMPTTRFSKGVREGGLMGKDFRGVLLVLLACIQSTGGWEVIKGGKHQTKKDVAHMKDWVMLLETLLEWEAWLCQPELKMRYVKKLNLHNRYIMYLICKVANQVKGMGLKIVKFHALLHLLEDMILYGVALEMDTSFNGA